MAFKRLEDALSVGICTIKRVRYGLGTCLEQFSGSMQLNCEIPEAFRANNNPRESSVAKLAHFGCVVMVTLV